MLESLECRRFWSASLQNGILSVVGTDGPDRITIQHLPLKRAAVYVNGERVGTWNRYSFQGISIAGLAGKDRIFVDSFLNDGEDAPATLIGGGGNDQLITNGGQSLILGGNGRDFLSGGFSNDTLLGGANADTLNGGGSNDLLDGGGGNDQLIGWTGADQIRGGPGIDTVIYNLDHADGPVDRVNVSLDGVANDGFFEHPQYQPGTGVGRGEPIDTTHEYDNVAPDIENVVGTAFDDVITGSNDGNLLIGGGGKDTIDGKGGYDVSDSDPADTRHDIESLS